MMQTHNIPLPRLYDIDMREIGRFEPGKVGFDIKTNGLSTATIEMYDREQAPIVPQMRQFVELFDTTGSIGKFRIGTDDSKLTDVDDGIYSLSHAVSSLGDKVIDGYHEYGGTGKNTRSVLTTLLAMQNPVMWVLGECDFSYQSAYSFENDTVLTAVFSVPANFPDEYEWTYDTTVFPFVLNLKLMQDGDATEFRRSRNAKSVRIVADDDNLCTRLYPKGYGEGDNQLTIKSVNGGVPYLDSNTQGIYGIIEREWADTTFTTAASLKAYGQKVLDAMKEPATTITLEAYDLYEVTGETLDAFHLSRLVRYPIPKRGTIRERVIGIKKSDVYGNPEEATLTLRNKSADITDQLAELTRKATIGELYSQGATNMYAEHYADNADADHPLSMKFYIDEQCVHINGVLLRFDLEAFRAYSKGTASGGGSTQTSSAGGYQNMTKPLTVYIDNNTTGGPIDTLSGYSKPNTDLVDAGITGQSSQSVTGSAGTYENTGGASITNTGGASVYTTSAATGNTGNATAGHYHTIGSHQHLQTSGTYTGATTPSCSISDDTNHFHGLGSHTHTMGHTHNVEHTHAIGAHVHTMSHTHSVPTHAHGMNHFHFLNLVIRIPDLTITVADHTHNVTVPTHSHDNVNGIFEGGTAASVTIKVDGTSVVSGDISNGSVDIVSYLAKDSDGIITRNTWHSIEVTPNALTRIVADVFVKTFIRSIGGGTY